MNQKKYEWEKTIGLVRYAGQYQPSNETSAEKLARLAWRQSIDEENILSFLSHAKIAGYEVIIFSRGINR